MREKRRAANFRPRRAVLEKTMAHLPALIQDLALILIAAGAMTLLFRAIGQPVVLGYIIAGFLVSPNVRWLPSIVDPEGVKVWAEIGVIFLLFSLGLEFSFKKLARVGASAAITAIVEVVGMVGVGFLIGRAFGWNSMDSLFLGGILAISSTTIIIRAFEELGLKTKGVARLVFGVLVIEDLVAILLMVVLTTVAVSQTFSGVEMGVSTLKLGFFLVLWFVLGIFLLPIFLKFTKRLLRSETLLIVSLGLCFLMVVTATKAGFSPALGAFIMGSILAETLEGERIEHLIEPVKNLFAAVFFVSVGMLIDPAVLTEYWKPILVITVGTIVGKTITTALGALASGQSLRHSVQAGMSLAQIGEFSFIIAGLGTSLKVTSDFLYPIAISVSAVTTFTTPYLIRSADGLVVTLEKHLPRRWLNALESFRSASSQAAHASEWRQFFRRSSMKLVTNGVMVSAIFLLSSEYLWPYLATLTGKRTLAAALSLLVAFALALPFVWAMVLGRTGSDAERRLWRDKRYSSTLLVTQGVRWVLTLSLLAALCSRFVPMGFVGVAAFVVFFSAALLLSRRVSQVYLWLESRFVENLHQKEETKELPPLAPWDSHLAELTISPESPLVGQALSEAKIRERYGATVVLVGRGSRVIPAPGRNERIYPFDRLQVIGTDEQIARLKEECERSSGETSAGLRGLDYSLHPIYVDDNSSYANKTIRECGLREASNGLIVGIEKKGERSLNPDSTTLIEPGDVVWVVGDRQRLTRL